MYRFKAIAHFLVIILFIQGCKKGPAASLIPGNSPNSREKFVDTVTLNVSQPNALFVANTKSANQFYIFQKQSSNSLTFYKADADMKVSLTKTISLTTASVIGVTGSQVSDDFYILGSTYNFSYGSSQVINAYVYAGVTRDSLIACDSVPYNCYNFNPAFNPSAEINLQNQSILQKYDPNGTISWSKMLEGNFYQGNCMETDLYGNVYVLTATRGGYAPRLNSIYSNSLSAFYDMKLDSNQFSLYKFDINGTQVFKKTFTGIREDIAGQFKPMLALSGKNVSVNNQNCIYVFDPDGNLILTTKPIKNSCYNYVYNCLGNGFSDNLLVHGTLNYNNGNQSAQKYLATINNGAYTGTVSSNISSSSSLMDRHEKCYYLQPGGSITKTDINGNILYDKTLYYAGWNVLSGNFCAVADKYGAFYLFQARTNAILVYKLDSSGNFQ
jgi:hypothetical protein